MESPRQLRHRLFVDPEVQAALILRVMTYWMLCLAAVALMLFCWQVVSLPTRSIWGHLEDLWFRFGPPFFASLIVLPLILMDIIRLSNRFSGPLIRVRRTMRALARGERVARLRFRKDDFWQNFAEECNAVAKRIADLECAVATAAAASAENRPSSSLERRNPSLSCPESSVPSRPVVLTPLPAEVATPAFADQI